MTDDVLGPKARRQLDRMREAYDRGMLNLQETEEGRIEILSDLAKEYEASHGQEWSDEVEAGVLAALGLEAETVPFRSIYPEHLDNGVYRWQVRGAEALAGLGDGRHSVDLGGPMFKVTLSGGGQDYTAVLRVKDKTTAQDGIHASGFLTFPGYEGEFELTADPATGAGEGTFKVYARPLDPAWHDAQYETALLRCWDATWGPQPA